jgi:TRAP-type C4-dicarboxylate transport system permease small subunit
MHDLLEKVGLKVDRVIEIAITVVFVVMVLVGGLQVFNRFIINQSLSWSEEFQKFSHIWLIFLTIPVAYNRGSHIGMEILFKKFPAQARKLLSILFDLLWMGMAVATIYYSSVIMGVARTQTSAGLGIRMDWVYSGLVVGGVYLLFVSIRKLVLHRTDVN